MKTCFRCLESKPITEFYKHSAMADGHLGKCKVCTRRDTAERYRRIAADPKQSAEEAARQRRKTTRYRLGNPEIIAAHKAVKAAILDGRLERQPCEVCGHRKVDAHHDDYSKPLDVRWLCRKHHIAHHVREREAAASAA